jgi:hypothetical protein
MMTSNTVPKILMELKGIEDDEMEAWDITEKEKEESLERVRNRQLEWQAGRALKAMEIRNIEAGTEPSTGGPA